MQQFSQEEIDRALRSAPRAVQEMINAPETIEAIVTIGRNQNLHVNTVGLLARLNRDMLLGLITPEQLTAGLATDGIESKKSQRVLVELNSLIFKPLHEKMRNEAGKPARAPLTNVPAPLGTTPPLPTAPIAPAAPLPPVTTSAPVAPPAPRPEPVIPPTVFEPRPPRIEREVAAPASIAPLPAPVPKNYARDPYREPIDEGTPQ